ncbi:zinc-dependent peptidase [Actomonas aquatica]|uniref:M90 family metallopeptidase n=1 Tax=Actomonas aquatica TaxID=2866162 RepID=A0ABZ1C6Z0_9BACT|nr:M90 family metallopeptidase [Opitutus sp. WL0086]WRQ86289.1 M90 family metallopeptidase [Opitutus sp. WL0086]
MSFWTRLAAWLNPPDPGPVVFDPAWIAILEANVPLYQHLPADLRETLHQQIARFVRDKHFEACGGLTLTDEMVLTVAGQACVLCLKLPGPPFPRLRSILLYPAAYRARERLVDELGIVVEREVVRLGESSSRGTIVLAWNAVLSGARNTFDGHNVTLHEFAHQLDQADGRADGTPFLRAPEHYARWTHVLTDGHARLERLAADGKRTVLDTYGATNPAEYFAVATEAFFEKPRQLARKRPDLYAELQTYYQLDPQTWYSKG